MKERVYFTELPRVFTTMIEKVVVDGKEYNNIMEWYNSLEKKEGNFVISLNSKVVKPVSLKRPEQELRIIV